MLLRKQCEGKVMARMAMSRFSRRVMQLAMGDAVPGGKMPYMAKTRSFPMDQTTEEEFGRIYSTPTEFSSGDRSNTAGPGLLAVPARVFCAIRSIGEYDQVRTR